jgi:magnesium-protoporphyrin O-methyltransferase
MSDPALGRFDFTLAMDSLIYYRDADIGRVIGNLAPARANPSSSPSPRARPS